MEFRIKKREPHHHKINLEDAKLVRQLTVSLIQELGVFVKSVVLFGSSTKDPMHEHDIDVLLIIDDLTRIVTPEVIEAYRIIVEKVGAGISKRFHISTLRLGEMWEQARNGDPLFINMLRDGVVFHDVGVFEPLQHLLSQGKIRPTQESVDNYAARAPVTMQNSNWHIMQACIDLYWACIDMAHAVLMMKGTLPPGPAHVPSLIREQLVKPGIVSKSSADTIEALYKLQKDIAHRMIAKISGKEYDEYRKRAAKFLNEFTKVLRS